MTHNSLPKTVKAMFVMCRLPIRSNERFGEIVVLHAWLTAIHVLVELHAYGVNTVQVMEHVRPTLTVSEISVVESVVLRRTYSKWYL